MYIHPRLKHGFDYQRLIIEISAGEFINGSIKLSDEDFNICLNHFIQKENYEVCQLLVNKRKGQ